MKKLAPLLIAPFRRLGRRFWIRFLVAFVLAIAGELLLEHLIDTGETPGIVQSVFNWSGFYQKLVATGRKPSPRFTAIVQFDPKSDDVPGLHDVCSQRAKMANLLLHIAAATPRVIVVDKYLYDQKPKCASDKELGDALTEITQNLMIPVVYGRVASDELVVSPNKDKAVYLEPSVSFQCDGLKEGILNIDRDTRKVPLQWQIFSSKEAAQNGDSLQPFDTLPLVAARAFDSRLAANESEVSRYTAQHVHPYTSFIRKEDFQVVPVGLILNPEERQIDESDPCRLPKPDPTRLALRGKVVLIGELDNSDLHPSVLGDMPGLYMQANYIEALLDNRIYRPMPALDYVVGFLFLAALELIFIVFHGRWFLMAALIVQLLAATIFLLYLFMVHLGWYVDPALVGVIALAIRLFHTLFDPAEHAAHARKHR